MSELFIASVPSWSESSTLIQEVSVRDLAGAFFNKELRQLVHQTPVSISVFISHRSDDSAVSEIKTECCPIMTDRYFVPISI